MFRSCIPAIVAFAFLCAPPTLRAQNLVPNPSFEVLTSCPLYTGLVTLASPWWNCCTGGSDLFNDSCAAPGLDEGGHTGHGCSGQYLFCDGYADCREYTETRLLSPLDAGKTYCVSFFVKRRRYPYRYAVDRVGAHLSTDSINLAGFGTYIPMVPQVESAAGTLLADTGWTEVSGQFTADGDEVFITIGNFRNDANTLIEVEEAAAPFNSAYYFLDDVSVTLCESPANGMAQNGVLPMDVYPRPASDQVRVRLSNASGNWSFLLRDLLGQTVPMPLPQHAAADTWILDVSSMRSGAYILQGRNSAGTVARTVIIVQ